MSPKLSKKSSKSTKSKKKGGKDAKKEPTDQDLLQGDVIAPPVEPAPVTDQSSFRTVTICLEAYQNVVGLFPSADIKASGIYNDKSIGESSCIPITDEENLVLNECFTFEIDEYSAKAMDQLISTPAILNFVQSVGTLDPTIYEQLLPREDIASVKSFDSAISIYTALTGAGVSVGTSRTQIKGKEKKKKGEKSKSEKAKKAKGKVEKKNKRKKSDSRSKSSSRRSTEDKTNVTLEEPRIPPPIGFGTCAIDFLPLFYGETEYTETLLIKPLEKYTDDRMNTFKAHPKVTITVLLDEPFKLKSPLTMNFTVESIYNVPSMMKPEMDYTLSCMLPAEDSQHNAQNIVFSNPVYTKKSNFDVFKCWPTLPRGNEVNRTKYKLSTGNVSGKFGKDFGEYMQDEGPRLEFNMVKRNLLLEDGLSDLTSHAQTYRNMIMEFYMTNPGKSGKKASVATLQRLRSLAASVMNELEPKKGKNINSPFLHLMAIFNISELLYPGVTKIRAAVPLRTFVEAEATKVGGLKDSYFIPFAKKESASAHKAASTHKDDSSKKDKPSKGGKSSKGSKSSMKSKSKKSKKSKKNEVSDRSLNKLLPPKPQEPLPIEPSIEVYNEDGKPCFVVIEIELSRPMVPKRELEDLNEELFELLEKKPDDPPKIVLTRCLSKDYYKTILSDIIRELHQKFERFLEESPHYRMKPYKTPKDFIDFLKSIGSYPLYLASLTKAATLLVTNKFQLDDNVKNDQKVYQNFIGEVFVYLVSEMHDSVNKLVCNGLEPDPPDLVEMNQSFSYAKEACQIGKTSTADRFLLERICKDRNNPHYWFDYAVFHLEMRDKDKAFECVQEALSKKSNHPYSLLLFGMLLEDKGQRNEAETCFLNLLSQESKWLEGWGVLYLFYQKNDRWEGMDWALDMAKDRLGEESTVDYFTAFEDLLWTKNILPETVFFRTATILLKMHMYEWTEMACAQEIQLKYGLANYLISAICYYKELYDHALEHIEEAKRFYGLDYAVAGLAGHCLLALDKQEEAKEEYYKALTSFDRPNNLHLTYMNCAQVLENLGEDQEARKLVLLACKYNPTPYTWLRAGQLYFLLDDVVFTRKENSPYSTVANHELKPTISRMENDLLSAEECFSTANMLDNRDAEIWGYLTLVNLKLYRQNEAELCYQQAIKNKLKQEFVNKIQQEFGKMC